MIRRAIYLSILSFTLILNSCTTEHSKIVLAEYGGKNITMSEFEKEIRELMKKYNVKLVSGEQYDNEENHIGDTYTFQDDQGLYLPVSDLEE